MPPVPKRPRTPKPRGERRAFPRRSGGSIWYGLAILLLLALAQTYFLVPTGKTVPYSEFKALLREGKVAEVTVSEETIRGTLKQAKVTSSDILFILR